MFYVYVHKDPITNEVLYVGEGKKERAWRCGHKGTSFRSKNYTIYLDELLSKGFIPCDWVSIVRRDLTKEEARQIEKDLIKELEPRFNCDQKKVQTKVPYEEHCLMLSLYKDGNTIASIQRTLPHWSYGTVKDHVVRGRGGY